jgi:hygromycin-B 7''-O-kinase
MGATGPLARLGTLEGYRISFTDAVLWRPYVERICRERDWSCNLVRTGVAGTFPAFIVDERRVVKFFGRLFEGERCWRVEQEAAQLLSNNPAIPVVRQLASGVLEKEPGWMYLVFEYIPGVSIGEVYTRIPFEEKLSLAGWLGEWLPKMHRIEVQEATALPYLSKELARGWFNSRWPREPGGWPVHLARQVEAYLSAKGSFFQGGHESFIHADLTQDHFLGLFQSGHWKTLAVIDLGDAMQGNIYYELAALHLDLFNCDKRLLMAFLRAYGMPPDKDFVHKAMATSLLHQFDVYAPLFGWKTELMESSTLDELAERIWNVND